MAEIFLHSRSLDSVFELLGSNENDITFSIGWTLAKSDGFLRKLIQQLFPAIGPIDPTEVKITLQKHDHDGGFTDVEIQGRDFHVIVEAKRGWELPSLEQLNRYQPRFREGSRQNLAYLTMSECSDVYFSLNLPAIIGDVQVRHLSWRVVLALCDQKTDSLSEKRVMTELRGYLRKIVPMQNQTSNMVFLVSLNKSEWAPGLTFIEIVRDRKKYFHPFAKGGWPKEPPNYVGFRFDGRLQFIHHVESAEVITNFHQAFPEREDKEEPPHFLYELGPALEPPRKVKNGNIYPNGRMWAMLDLLLTSDTISQACQKTKERQSNV